MDVIEVMHSIRIGSARPRHTTLIQSQTMWSSMILSITKMHSSRTEYLWENDVYKVMYTVVADAEN